MKKNRYSNRREKGAVARRELVSISNEYAQAVDLIHSFRSAGMHPGQEKALYWSLPATQVSADFFCTAEHPQHGWFGFLADAAGHGLAPAIFALHIPVMFREAAMLGMSLAAIYERINRFLLRQRVEQYFVCGVLLRIRGREVEVVNAGMPDVWLQDARGRTLHRFASRDLPFGIYQSVPPESEGYRLGRDEQAALLLYSDGLAELGQGTSLAARVRERMAGVGASGGFAELCALIEQHRELAHDDVSAVLVPLPMLGEGAAVADGQELTDVFPTAGAASAMRIVEGIDRGLLLTDAEQRIIYVNPAFSAITGYVACEVLGQTPRLLASGRHGEAFYRDMWRALRMQDSWSGLLWNRRRDGSIYLEWLELRVLRDEQGEVINYLGVFAVESQQGQQQEALQRLALHDPLTGLPNRLFLNELGERLLHRCERSRRPLALLYLDLDRFYQTNDSLGHDVGDLILVEVAQRWQRAMRKEDTLAHLGGDRFVALVADMTERDDAALVARKLLQALEEPLRVAGHCLKLTASIGIGTFPLPACQFDDLLIYAERAMHAAKEAGGNLFRFYSPQMAAAAVEELEMEARLDVAIRDGQLRLYFQPKLDLATRRIVGAEALVRWEDPVHGLVSPGAFIPLAEKSDLIARIGHWVLDQACAALGRWGACLPEGFQLAVNVSPLQFARSNLVDEVSRALDCHRTPPQRLQIEVTESLFIRDELEVARTLDAIAALGVSVALDDFGTGYSSIGSLSRLPFDTFKLDQRFVRAVDASPTNGVIARAVIHLAEGLGKQVVAEGIETCDECAKVRGLGYQIGQGYKFGRPLSEHEFLAHLLGWTPESCACNGIAFCPSTSAGDVAEVMFGHA